MPVGQHKNVVLITHQAAAHHFHGLHPDLDNHGWQVVSETQQLQSPVYLPRGLLENAHVVVHTDCNHHTSSALIDAAKHARCPVILQMDACLNTRTHSSIKANRTSSCDQPPPTSSSPVANTTKPSLRHSAIVPSLLASLDWHNCNHIYSNIPPAQSTKASSSPQPTNPPSRLKVNPDSSTRSSKFSSTPKRSTFQSHGESTPPSPRNSACIPITNRWPNRSPRYKQYSRAPPRLPLKPCLPTSPLRFSTHIPGRCGSHPPLFIKVHLN